MKDSDGGPINGTIRENLLPGAAREYEVILAESECVAGRMTTKLSHPSCGGASEQEEPSKAKKEPWLKLTWIRNATKRELDTGWEGVEIPHLGKALIERLIKEAMDWNNPYHGRLFLKSYPHRISYYWNLGFRPHPDTNRAVLDSFYYIYDKLKDNLQLDEDAEKSLYHEKRSEVAKTKGIPEEQVSAEDICMVDVTQTLQPLFKDKTAKDLKAIDTTFLQDQVMYLPPEAQQMWKERMLTAPLVVHEPRFLNQLLLEKVGQAPQKVRDLVRDYYGEEATV